MKGPAKIWRFLNFGDLIAGAAGLAEGSESRQILRMFLNVLIWGGICVGLVLLFAR